MDCLSTSSFRILPKASMTTMKCGSILPIHPEVQTSNYLGKDQPKLGRWQRTSLRTFISEVDWHSTPNQKVPSSPFHSIRWRLMHHADFTEQLAVTDFCIY